VWRTTLAAITAGTLTIPRTGDLVARYGQLETRLTTIAPMAVPQIIDNLFPAGNQELAALRQAALLIGQTIQTAQELLNELRTDITQPELPGTQGQSIRIMSLHKSKGLTAKLVVIAGCVSGILPTIDTHASLQEQNRQRQEQRRLFYVGLTRSTETLVISSAVRIQRGAAMQMGIPVPPGNQYGNVTLPASPFLAELGPAAPASIDGNTWRATLGF
jgi:DNA helicase-2/ATP-dependent DNA helicase PcrA